MKEYFTEQQFISAKKQRKIVIGGYIGVMILYVILSVGIFLWYRTFPYLDPRINTAKFIHYSLTALMVIFSFIYLGIPFKRVNRFYRITYQMLTGIRETSTGSFFEYDETLQDKDGVDMKSLIFIEWNKYKNDFFERKVLVFDELEFPKIPENANVRYITQGNVLISYEILDIPTDETNEEESAAEEKIEESKEKTDKGE